MTKYYKLKKDLPTFKAGEEFSLDVEGNLVLSDGETYKIIYHYKELEKFPNILKDWFEEIKEGMRWRGEVGQTYWWVNDSYDYADVETEDRDAVDEFRYRFGNYFKTKKEAEKYGEYLIALQVIKDDTKGFVPDWDDVLQGKYKGLYDHTRKKFDLISVNTFQSLGTIYFKNKEDIKESLKKHRKEWLIVLGVENEDND